MLYRKISLFTQLLMVTFFTFSVNGAMSIGGYNVYFGDLHNHSAVDDAGHAVGTPEQAYDYARNTAQLDFLGLTSHDVYITSTEWTSMAAAAAAATVDGAFVAFRGFEWTTNYLGHVAVVNSLDYCTSTQSATDTYAEFMTWVNNRSAQGCVAFLNHPGRQNGTGIEFGHFVGTPPPNLVGMELWNKSDAYTVYYYNDGYFSNDNNKGYFDEALSRGWKLGASGAGDNHSGTWGTANGYRMGVLAPNLTHADIVSALQARRFFSTLDKNLALSFTIANSEMGSTVIGQNDQLLRIAAVDGDNEIFTEAILYDKNHAVVATWNLNVTAIDANLTLSTYDNDYYYVKVRQADGDEAISSPVWVSGGQVNTPPVCNLTAPLGNETYTAPAQVFCAAIASDEGAVAQVAFYAGSICIGVDVDAPYEVTWNNAPAGDCTITAVATDNGGAQTTSNAVALTIASPAGLFTVEKRVGASSDDAEENTATGAVDATSSSDLEIAYDAGLNKNQIVGVRFNGCEIPANATITSAYIQFTCKEAGTSSSSIVIAGEVAANPVTFSATAYSLSSRTKTNVTTAWNAPVWNTVGAATVNERTPDLSSILQEIVSSDTYDQSSAIVFLFSGSGTRCAYSFSGSASSAALLHVEYSTLPPVNTPPVCAVTAPVNGTSYVGVTDVVVEASAQDAVGNVANVEFLLNGLAVGTDAAAPYAFTIAALEAGSYQLSVKATDDSGAVAQSQAITITVREQNQLPVCNITSPLTGTVFTAPASVTISADAADGDGSIAKVEFFANGTKLGEDVTMPYTYTWTNVAAGTYSLTVVATDSDNGLSTSAGIGITVNAAPLPVVVQKRISAGADDAEEYTKGTTLLSSPVIELVYGSKTTGNQTVGLRFTGCNIPNGAVVTTAYLQFKSNIKKTGTNNVVIAGEAADNPAPFAATSKNISSRAKTSTVAWAIPSWNAGAETTAQRSPELKTVLQSIVNRAGYTSASAIAFIVTGNGTKSAYSYEGAAASAPLLYVEYILP